jgi:hypothetical protein
MADFDQTFPPALTELHELEFDYADGQGIDFEPFESFFPAEENASWIKAWTGNAELTGEAYRIFGQDGTGGYAAFWLTREGRPLLEQPIVFFGSEGEVGVIASDFADYLWLLADGVGPYEAVAYGAEETRANPTFTAFAEQHAPDAKKSAKEVLSRARAEFPSFVDDFLALVR